MRVVSRLSRVLALLSMLVGTPSDAEAQIQVDVALVLAVDVSYSVDPAKSILQREGYVDAFRSVPVAQAILSGPLGRVAVAYVEWAGEAHQRVLIPWTVIDSQDASLAFADTLASHPLWHAPGTSISGAIDFSTSLFGPVQIEAVRRVQGRITTPWIETPAEALAARLASGQPLLEFPQIAFDWNDVRLLVRQITDVLRRHEVIDAATATALHSVGRSPTLPDVMRAWFEQQPTLDIEMLHEVLGV